MSYRTILWLAQQASRSKKTKRFFDMLKDPKKKARFLEKTKESKAYNRLKALKQKTGQEIMDFQKTGKIQKKLAGGLLRQGIKIIYRDPASRKALHALKDFILKSINTFTFENFDFGKKWFQKLQKRDWNNVDWIYNNIKSFREKEFILSDAYPHSHFSNLFRFQYITLFFKRPLYTIKWYLYERMPIYIQHRKILKDTVDYLISEDARDIIEKFPVSNQPGSPFYFTYKNLDVNDRSLMHYHHVNKIRKYNDRI